MPCKAVGTPIPYFSCLQESVPKSLNIQCPPFSWTQWIPFEHFLPSI
jgi:hypothetical protein